MLSKLFSRTGFLVACITMALGASSAEATAAVEATDNPELIKFLAPIVASVLTKFMEHLFTLLAKRKAKREGVINEL